MNATKTTTERLYYTAQDLSEMLGVSVGFSYKLIREMNVSLKKEGYICLSGKIPRKYFEAKYFGFGA